jgi:3-hydroxyisobutyrate dehydrogenase
MILAPCTITSTRAELLAKQANQQGHTFLDAAGSGTAGAAIWILTVMVGGSVSAFEFAKTVLAKMGKSCCSLRRIRTGKVAKISPIQSTKPPWPASQNRCPGVTFGKDSLVKTGISARQASDAKGPKLTRAISSLRWPPCGYSAGLGLGLGLGMDIEVEDLGIEIDAAKLTKQPACISALAR